VLFRSLFSSMLRGLGSYMMLESDLLCLIIYKLRVVEFARILPEMDRSDAAWLLLSPPLVQSSLYVVVRLLDTIVAAILSAAPCEISAGTMICGMHPKKVERVLSHVQRLKGKCWADKIAEEMIWMVDDDEEDEAGEEEEDASFGEGTELVVHPLVREIVIVSGTLLDNIMHKMERQAPLEEADFTALFDVRLLGEGERLVQIYAYFLRPLRRPWA